MKQKRTWFCNSRSVLGSRTAESGRKEGANQVAPKSDEGGSTSNSQSSVPKCHYYVTIYGTVISLPTSSQRLTISSRGNGDILQNFTPRFASIRVGRVARKTGIFRNSDSGFTPATVKPAVRNGQNRTIPKSLSIRPRCTRHLRDQSSKSYGFCIAMRGAVSFSEKTGNSRNPIFALVTCDHCPKTPAQVFAAACFRRRPKLRRGLKSLLAARTFSSLRR
jgi:hypothetical protein